MKKCQFNVNGAACGVPAKFKATRVPGDEERLDHPMAAFHEFYLCTGHVPPAVEWSPTPITLVQVDHERLLK
jgi:hypothetical protein